MSARSGAAKRATALAVTAALPMGLLGCEVADASVTAHGTPGAHRAGV